MLACLDKDCVSWDLGIKRGRVKGNVMRDLCYGVCDHLLSNHTKHKCLQTTIFSKLFFLSTGA